MLSLQTFKHLLKTVWKVFIVKKVTFSIITGIKYSKTINHMDNSWDLFKLFVKI